MCVWGHRRRALWPNWAHAMSTPGAEDADPAGCAIGMGGCVFCALQRYANIGVGKWCELRAGCEVLLSVFQTLLHPSPPPSPAQAINQAAKSSPPPKALASSLKTDILRPLFPHQLQSEAAGGKMWTGSQQRVLTPNFLCDGVQPIRHQAWYFI